MIPDNPTYSQIVESFGYDSNRAATFGDWQGDHVYLLKDGDRRGFLIIGYGSCSGCDTLQAVEHDREAVQEYADRLENNVRWFDDLHKLKLWLMSSDIDWYVHENGFQAWAEEFIGGGFVFK